MKENDTSIIQVSQFMTSTARPICVHKTDSLERAETLLLMNNYSQLPVVTGRNKIEGYISWQTIHSALLHGTKGTSVEDFYSTDYHTFPISSTILDILQEIERNEFVMLYDEKDCICAILTASDFTKQYMQLVQPFILLYEFEKSLRCLLSGVLLEEDIKTILQPENCPNTNHIHIEDLTLGQYCLWIEQDNNFDKLQLPNTNREAFLHQIGVIREIRNKVMHFRTIGLCSSEMNILRNTVRYMRAIVETKINN